MNNSHRKNKGQGPRWTKTAFFVYLSWFPRGTALLKASGQIPQKAEPPSLLEEGGARSPTLVD